ncbi:MAG: hypothetical protein WEB06_17925 [Actinomycetota bacterium]
MASKRAAIPAIALLVASAVGVLGSVRGVGAQTPPDAAPRRAAFVVLPETEALSVFASRPFQVGLGVFPPSRDPVRFIREVGYGSPSQEPDADDQPPSLPQALRSDRVQVFPPGLEGRREVIEAIEAAFEPGFNPSFGGDRRLEVYSLSSATTMDRIIGITDGPVIVLGVGDRSPVRIGICERACLERGRSSPPGVLKGGITRRPGIVTPYDLGVTILDRLGVSPIPEGFIGEPLTSEPDPDALQRVDSLASRLERDDSFAPGLAASAVGTGGLLVIFAWLLRKLSRTTLAMRLAQAAVFVLPGWVLAEFIPSSAWGVRAIPIFVGALLGAAIDPRDPVRTMARVGFGSAFGFAVLVAIAPLNPGSEPGLSIWGNPLVSWRFFGAQNVQAAIIASGMVVWGVLAGLAARVLAVVALGAAIVVGAPAIGANFVGVLTFVLGAAVAITALVRRRASLGQLLASGALAVGAFVLALLADAGSPVSHGGRAARRISSDGWAAARDLIEGRLRLNVELIRDFSGGWIFVTLLLVTLAALIAWGLRTEQGPLRARVAVLAGALMALASMVLEDSGFYSGAVLWFVAADAWLLVSLAPGLGVIPPVGDVPLAGVGSDTRPPQPGSARRSRSSPD